MIEKVVVARDDGARTAHLGKRDQIVVGWIADDPRGRHGIGKHDGDAFECRDCQGGFVFADSRLKVGATESVADFNAQSRARNCLEGALPNGIQDQSRWTRRPRDDA